MPSDDQKLTALVERVERMERQNRRIKFSGAVVLVLAAGTLLMGQASPMRRVVEAEEFVLRDESGVKRGALAVLPGGVAGLAISDRSGEPRVSLTVYHGGEPVLTLSDKDGRSRASLVLLPDGSPSFYLKDQSGKVRSVLGAISLQAMQTGEITQRSESSIVLFSKEGKAVWKTP